MVQLQLLNSINSRLADVQARLARLEDRLLGLEEEERKEAILEAGLWDWLQGRPMEEYWEWGLRIWNMMFSAPMAFFFVVAAVEAQGWRKAIFFAALGFILHPTTAIVGMGCRVVYLISTWRIWRCCRRARTPAAADAPPPAAGDVPADRPGGPPAADNISLEAIRAVVAPAYEAPGGWPIRAILNLLWRPRQ